MYFFSMSCEGHWRGRGKVLPMASKASWRLWIFYIIVEKGDVKKYVYNIGQHYSPTLFFLPFNIDKRASSSSSSAVRVSAIFCAAFKLSLCFLIRCVISATNESRCWGSLILRLLALKSKRLGRIPSMTKRLSPSDGGTEKSKATPFWSLKAWYSFWIPLERTIHQVYMSIKLASHNSSTGAISTYGQDRISTKTSLAGSASFNEYLSLKKLDLLCLCSQLQAYIFELPSVIDHGI